MITIESTVAFTSSFTKLPESERLQAALKLIADFVKDEPSVAALAVQLNSSTASKFDSAYAAILLLSIYHKLIKWQNESKDLSKVFDI